ncbi:MAG: 4'-phosphopantetheinyl transferase superfamily protein [Verrucomicrobiota bacterium]
MIHLPARFDEPLESDEVRVFAFGLDDEEALPLEIGRSWLSIDELERAGAFRFENLQDRFIRGRAVVRKILGQYLDKEPSELRFKLGEKGKPHLADSSLHFNLSHSLDRGVLAVSSLPSIGIDLEYFKREVNVEALSRRCFRDSEIQRIDRLNDEERKRAFFWTWTAKEARMKATGEGFGLEPQRIEIEFDGHLPKVCLEPVDPSSFVAPVVFPDEAVACTVAATQPFRIKVCETEISFR